MNNAIDITAAQRDIILALLGKHLPNTAAWVYGSRATWNARPQSDLDMVVFATPAQERGVSDLRDAFEESALPFRVDLFVWDAVPESFHKQIEAEHVVLVEKEEEVSRNPLHVPIGIGTVPVKWRWSRLEDVCDGIFDCPHSTPNLSDSGPLMVRTQDILSGVFRTDQAGHVSEETYRERTKRAEPTHGDLFYSCEGTYFGIAAEVPRNYRVCLGQRMVLLRPNPQAVDFRYLRFWLNGPAMEAHIHGFRDGSVAERLNLPTIRLLPVLLPPLPEQRAIAHILGTLDDKIELNRRMNETLEEMARVLFKSWFVDFDPVHAKATLKHHAANQAPRQAVSTLATEAARSEITPPPGGSDWTVERARTYLDGMDADIAALFPDSFVDSELREIPKGWVVCPLGEAVETVKGRSYRRRELIESDTALVTLKSFVRGGGYRPEGLKSLAGTYSSDQVVHPGEIVIACTDVTQAADVIGRPAIVQATALYRTLVASLDTLIVRPSRKGMTRTFLYFLASSDEFVAPTYAHTTGTTVLHLAKNAVPSYRFIQPPTQLVQRFDDIAGPLLERIQEARKESEFLAVLRDTLLPELISGKLRVKDMENTLEQH